MNAQSGVCTPAGGLMTGEHPSSTHTVFSRVHDSEMGGKERKEPGVRVAPSSVPQRGSLLGGSRGGRATRSRHPHTPTGALVLLSLDYLTSLFYYIPKSALAAVIIMAVVPLFDTKIVRTLWRVKSMCLLSVGPVVYQ